MREGLRVGELAEMAGVSGPTIRFYERAGLLAVPQRSQAGYRLYPAETVADLRFITRAKALGLSLEQIKVLLAQPGAGTGRRELRHLVAHQLVRTRQRLEELQALQDGLSQLFAALAGPPEGHGGQLPATGAGTPAAQQDAAALLAGETAWIEAAQCRCTCPLDPGCTCGCPCCTPAGASPAAGEADDPGEGDQCTSHG